MRTKRNKSKAVLGIFSVVVMAGAFGTTPYSGIGLRSAVAAPVAANVPTDASNVCPAKPGSTLPKLSLRNLDGAAFDLNASVAKMPTVLVFYRGGWCPYCNKQLAGLRLAQPELAKLGYQLVAVSPDLPDELKKSVEKEELSYTLLSDSAMTAAKALGIAFRVDDATVEKYQGYGIDLEKRSGEKHHLLPVPAIFVISTDGKVHFSYVNPDYTVRLEPEVILAAAKAALPPKGINTAKK